MSDAFDWTAIDERDQPAVRAAIARGDNFHGYVPSQSFAFILANVCALAAASVLEAAWADAYIHASHFNDTDLDTLAGVFEACDRQRLRALKPLGDLAIVARNGRMSVFRGCAGPVHRMGMSWTPSLDKAIWYAAKHAAYHDLAEAAVYVATVGIEEIFCRFDHYDDDVIVRPAQAWRIDVPDRAFRLDRAR